MIWRRILILCIVSLSGNVNAAIAVVKGRKTTINNFPYSISLRTDNNHFCGGSIISERHIITAAHCFKSEHSPSWDTVTVVSGTSFAKEQGNVHQVLNITIHAGYNTDGNSATNDVAVVTLKDTIVFNKTQKKINLPTHNIRVGDKAIVTGWGYIQNSPRILPNQLHVFHTEIMCREECQKKVINQKKTKIYDTEVCTTRKHGSGICGGDSGGPLVANDELVGIASWIDGDNCAGQEPDVFVNVFKYKNFIESVMNRTI